MNSTWVIVFEQDLLFYTLHLLSKKIMFMMNLLMMYLLLSCLISYQHLVNTFQECL